MQIINYEQGSPEWIAARIGKISGTRLADAIGTSAKQESLINELIAEKLTGERKENYVNLSMAKGSEAEEFAIQEYELKTGEITEQVGICVSDEFEWLVNSPDRLIKKDGKYPKAVEVKCPNTDTLIGYIRKGEIPKDYLPQIMSYFLVNDDLEELDFVGYDPRIQTDQYRLWIVNVKREDLPLKETKESLLKFYEKYQKELKELNLDL
jgi:putative phage-type endonuclease